MKTLLHFSHSKNQTGKPVCFLQGNREGVGEGQDPISELLSQPLSFSYLDLTHLEKAINAAGNKLTGGQQKQFQELVNLHLARMSNEAHGATPGRLLFALFRTPKLSQFLSAHQRRAIEFSLSRESKILETIAHRDAKDWTETEAITVARSYRYLRHRVNTVNLGVLENRKNVGDKLKQYALLVAEKPEADLTPKDHLFIIELKRLFPSRSDWQGVDPNVYSTLMGRAQSAKEKFYQQVQAPGALIPAEARFYWDVLTPTEDEVVPPRVEKFLQRSAETESLRALNAKTNFDEAIESARPLVLSSTEFAFLQEMAQTREQEPFAFEKGKITQELAKKERELEASSSNFQNLDQTYNARKQALSQMAPAAIKEESGIPAEHLAQFKSDWLDATKIDATPVASDANPSEAQKAWANFYQWRTQAAEAILAAQKEAVEKAKKDKENAQVLLDKAKEENEAALEAYNDYSAPQPLAQKLLEKHQKDFKTRLRTGQLVAGDFDFLHSLEQENATLSQEYLGQSGRSVLTVISQTRSAISNVVEESLGIDLNRELSGDEITSVDTFLSYETIIQQLAEDKNKGRETELVQAYQNLETQPQLNASRVIEALTLEIKTQILTRIESPAEKGGAYEDFLKNYTRQHHALERSDRVERLLAQSRVIDQQKNFHVNDAYEHAYEKVSALFASSEPESIKAGLNKILQANINVESVYAALQNLIPDNGFVHGEGSMTTKALKSQVVTILKDKVTPENADPIHLQMLAHDLLTRFDQLQAGQNAKESLRNGAKYLETTDDQHLSVSDRLELAKRTQLVMIEVEEINQHFASDLELIKETLSRKEEAKPHVLAFLSHFDNRYAPRLEALKKAFVAECDIYLGPDHPFTHQFKKDIENKIARLTTGVSGLRQLLNEDNIKEGDAGYNALQSAMNSVILPTFDLMNGVEAQKDELLTDSTLRNSAETHKYIRDTLGLLQPEGAEKAKQKYYEELKKYEQLVLDYQTSWEESRKRLQKDLKKYDEQEFAGRYQMSKKQAQDIIRENNIRAECGGNFIDFFSGKGDSFYPGSKSGFFDRWLAAYEDPTTQPKALDFMDTFREFANLIGPDQEKFAEEAKGFKAFAKDYDQNKPLLWFKKNYKIKINWYSLTALYRMIKQSWDAWDKSRERSRDQMTADLGAQIWGDTMIGREFARESNEKESERVDYWKNSYGSYDVAKLKEIIQSVKQIKHKDEARAAIEKLLENGEITLDSPIFLNLLERLQPGLRFSQAEIDSYVNNTSILRSKVGQAVSSIWDQPTWNKWEQDFKNKYASKMKEFNDDLLAESQTNASDDFMINALQNWATGNPDSSFYRSKFEQYIYGSFENGFMNGYPMGGDRRFFYLIKGMTTINPKTGEPLLNPESMVRLNKLESSYPYLGALDDRNSFKLNGRIVGADVPGAEQRPWNKDDVKQWASYFNGISFANSKSPAAGLAVRKWMNECLAPSGDTADRAGKINLRNLDQDDAGMVPPVTNPERLLDVLTMDSGENRPVKGDKYYVNMFNSVHKNVSDLMAQMRTVIRENPPGSEFRKRELTRFGQTLRNYFLMSQTLSGNWDNNHAVGVVTMSDAEWRLEGAEEAYKKVIDVVSQLSGDADINRYLKGKHYGVMARKKVTDKSLKAELDQVASVVEKIYDNKEIFSNEETLTNFINSYSG